MKTQPRRRQDTGDWTVPRERSPAAATATEELELPAEAARALLEERAKALARPLASPAAAGEALRVATFALANERYAIESRYVREIVRLEDFTPLPGAPAFILGVTNLRGEILAIVDLRRLLGVATPGLTDLARVIVVGEARPEFGLLADRAEGLVSLRAEEILPPPPPGDASGSPILRGPTREALIVLDGAALLADPRLTVDQVEATVP